MIIGIELDGPISSAVTNYYSIDEVEKCIVTEGTAESLQEIKKLGHTILIYTRRDASLGPATETWLQKNKIPYDRIIFNKPVYDVFVDHKAYKFSSWNQLITDNNIKLHNMKD